ncbi:ABC-F family ATP-binding cassette domain-containing protein [Amycolatopsis sp. DG1A-15b]|uniref:ABC-F family ATP-binding cassette domain-containing protein n=1 Tax=Amycolatopsis sp. DG1A-15b TaxID=3052846 RepID=UPI00255C08EB|nr:ABC-F family ATP-binding cassette domain-containing protein [Amycolatopsis sp. DG1A-15b]WIX91614.1 ABC-F family ATP-binding cassette domain-containing protein [Amycolatopsis sp. DG1A-15b]
MSTLFPLQAKDVVFGYGTRVVLDGVSLTASAGQRLGLVGENGTGKSTLLRLLAGLEEPRSGEVLRGPDVGFLLQELPHPPDATFADVLDGALAEIRAAAARLDELTTAMTDRPDDEGVLEEYGRVLEWAQAHDLWDADRRAKLVCDGLGLGGVAPDRRLGTLSGGQRSRLGLAALLIRQPETLLLDEPTNHLDDAAMAFLERHLIELTGIVVLSSHDRVFLDAVCTDIVDLDPAAADRQAGGAIRYGGSYTGYLGHKKAERARWEQRYAEEQEELKELRETVAVTARNVAYGRGPRDNDKFIHAFKGARVQKTISRRVRDAEQRLENLERDQVRKPPAPLRFKADLTARATGDGPAISARSLEVPGRLSLPRLDVGGSARLLVTGGNGAGKSTLLSVLAGRLAPAAGTVLFGHGVRVGLLEQDVVFAEPERNAARVYRDALGEDAPPLSRLGLLASRDLRQPVGALSVGQRRRLALAILLADPPDVLLLDEPTNHISLTLAEELFAALETAPGAVVIASHDRWLRRDWAGDRLELAAGRPVAV